MLFEHHYKGVARFFSAKIHDDHEDLIQATFLGCLERIDYFRRDASFRTLLFAIARNKLLKHLRERCRDNKYLSPAPRSVDACLPSSTSVLAARAQRKQLLEALRELSLDTQLMLELFYWEGLSVREIGGILELEINTVKTRMRRGRLRLASALGRLALAEGVVSSGADEREAEGFERWASDLRSRSHWLNTSRESRL